MAAAAVEPAPDFARALDVAGGSIVRVRATIVPPGGPARGPATFGNTGFLVSDHGDVVTSLLAVAGCSQISVAHPDGRTADAQIAAMDQAAGLALLKSDLGQTRPLQFAEELPAPGDWIALAYAADQAATDGSGMASMLEPALVTENDAGVRLNAIPWKGLLRASARACNGCAASPLLDRRGRVVGVVLAVHCQQPLSSVWQACDAYGLPASELQGIVERLRQGQSRRLGWLGVGVVDEPGDRQGARVAAVLENSPAHQAGIRPGDLLLQIDQSTIETPTAVAEIIARAEPGTAANIRLLRGGDIRTVTAKLEPRPLAICSAPPRSSSERLVNVQQLMEENMRLRARVWELEQRQQQLEERLRSLEPTDR